MNKVAKQIAVSAVAGALAIAVYRVALRPFLVEQFPHLSETL